MSDEFERLIARAEKAFAIAAADNEPDEPQHDGMSNVFKAARRKLLERLEAGDTP